ncbi:MAG: ComEC/Rec2 family competence protein [Clostridia bacterium]|nr:ComEC/Rec2 family competence protein [Clostridia bacterium]
MKKQSKIIYTILGIIGLSLFFILTAFLNINGNPDLSRAFGKLGTESENIATKQSFYISFIDVGQGDCALIKCDDKYMLIDAGDSSAVSKIESHLKAVGCKELDYVIITHPHADHIGGMPQIINDFKVNNVVIPDISSENLPSTKTFINTLKAIKESKAKVFKAQDTDEFDFGNAKVEIFSPKTKNDSLNNLSVVMKITYGKNSFLFTGDMEKDVESKLLKKFADNTKIFKSDVLKVAHHGSSTSSSKKFIQAVKPEIAVISCAENNDYHHPHSSVLKTLEENKVKIYRTDKNSTISVGSDGEKLYYHTKE